MHDEEDNFREIAGEGALERDGGEEEVLDPSLPRVAAAHGGGCCDAGPGALGPAAGRDAQARAGSLGEWRQGPSHGLWTRSVDSLSQDSVTSERPGDENAPAPIRGRGGASSCPSPPIGASNIAREDGPHCGDRSDTCLLYTSPSPRD